MGSIASSPDWYSFDLADGSFQFGDGFSNMFVPTSALVMGTLALGRIPYGRWLKFVLPLMVKLLIVSIVVLLVALYAGESLGLPS